MSRLSPADGVAGTATISRAEVRLPAAELGPQSPLPAFTGLQRLTDTSTLTSLPAEMRARIQYGKLSNPLPYPIQNGYGRELTVRTIPALRLANDRVEALVLPQYGGRVWSLRRLPDQRELVYRNPVLAFANFGLTNAWCAGGIEWNLGSTGHAATSTRPLFAARVPTAAGPILRLWEWERTRDLVFQIDLALPPGSDFLYASVRVSNPDGVDKPLYWWTNIAAREDDGVRVIGPAESAWRTGYEGTIRSVSMPCPADSQRDASYPALAEHAADYFFRIPDGRPRWIAALGSDGFGLVQTSTADLAGRKLFCWGRGGGGSRWQEWLCGPDRRYFEIQAGLATTQLEHLRLGAHQQISWSEAYGPVTADPALVHGEWGAAVGAIESALGRVLSEADLHLYHDRWRSAPADRPPDEILHRGSGFGRAELALRGRAADDLPATPFEPAGGDGSRHLMTLLAGGDPDPEEAAGELPIPPTGRAWDQVFGAAGRSWWVSLMIAVRAHAAGDLGTARVRYDESIRQHPSGLALRGQAVVAASLGDLDGAAERYLEAGVREPSLRPLLEEATEALLAADRAGECLQLIDSAPPSLRNHGRIVLQRVRALFQSGDRQGAAELLRAGFDVPDLREGETLEALWQLVFPGEALPARYDFRMHQDVDAQDPGRRPT